MSCFTGCTKQNTKINILRNRENQTPIRFNQNQLEELKKKFYKVSNNQKQITRDSFKKNMGILGLHCAKEFSGRMFNAFDLDTDGLINFQDFIEYMQILKCGNDSNKAKISFKMIAKSDDNKKGHKNKISQSDFLQFLNDFFNSWSSITNIAITGQIRQRTKQYVKFLFNKVYKQTNKQQIQVKYYIDKLYKDKEYIESFQFITQGMADIFINDDNQLYQNSPEAILYKLIKNLHEIKAMVFQMSNQNSYLYQPVRYQEPLRDLPRVNMMFKKPEDTKFQQKKVTIAQNLTQEYIPYNTRRKTNFSQSGNISNEHTQTHEHSKNLRQSRKNQSNNLYQNSRLLALQKKLKFIQQKIQNMLQQTKPIYESLTQKFDKKRQFSKAKNQASKNVHKKIKRKEGEMIFLGDDNWNLVLNMMIGIQMAVRSVKGFQEMIYEEPKDFGLKYYFQLIPKRFSNQDNNSTIFSFTDYAPNTFNHIRRLFNIDNEEYINSIGPNRLMASLMMGQVNSMTTLVSQGKSGSFFFYTADGKYMLKTIHYRQYKFLRQILQDYYYHLKSNPQTLITKFFGLHKLIEKNENGDQITRSYFIIMANVFNTKEKIVERYDIKGSTYGRQTDDKDPSATKKDLDFIKRSPIYLQEQQRSKLLQNIKKDAEFFNKHQIIDYSLLIGVIKKSQRQSEMSDIKLIQSKANLQQLNKSVINPRQSRIFISALEEEYQESYIFGIIDILTLYNSRKVLQYYFKSIFFGSGISAVPPADYAQRFTKFIENDVFPAQKPRQNLLRKL